MFVPGDQVTLGWDRWQHGMNEETSADLHETVSEYGVEDGAQYLDDGIRLDLRHVQHDAWTVE